MSKVSFKKASSIDVPEEDVQVKDTPEAVEPEVEETEVAEPEVESDGAEPTTLPEKAKTRAVARAGANKSAGLGGISGDTSHLNLQPPKIKIVQGTSDSEYPHGSIVLDDILCGEPNATSKEWSEPVYFTVLRGALVYKENLDYDSDDIPDWADSLEEVIERGGWVDYRKDSKGNTITPPWVPVFRMVILVEGTTPQAQESFTLFDPNDVPCEMALWEAKGSAFTRVGKRLIAIGQTSLRNRETGAAELHRGRFSLQVRREKLGEFNVWVPKIKMVGRHDEEYVEFLETLV